MLNLGRSQSNFYFVSHQIFILVSETKHSILNVFRRMSDEKHSGRQIEVMSWKFDVFLVFVSKFGDEARIFRRSDRAPLIQQVEYAQLLEVDKLKHSHVVLVRYCFEHICQTFSFEEFFFLLKNFGEIDLMQPLIGIINKQLLQAIALKYLKPIDIQKP